MFGVDTPKHTMYVISCDGNKIFLTRCIKNHKRGNVFIALVLPVRHSSYVSIIIIRSSMYIPLMISSNLKKEIRSL